LKISNILDSIAKKKYLYFSHRVRIICKVLRILKGILKELRARSCQMSTFEFCLTALARGKVKGKTLLVIEIIFTFFNTALHCHSPVLLLSVQRKT
jgi:hypothetical protein